MSELKDLTITLEERNEKFMKQLRTSRKTQKFITNRLLKASSRASNALRELRSARRKYKYLREQYSAIQDENQQSVDSLLKTETKLTDLESYVLQASLKSQSLEYTNRAMFDTITGVKSLEDRVQCLTDEKTNQQRSYEQKLLNLQQETDSFRYKCHTLASQLSRTHQQIDQLKVFKKEAREAVQLTQEGFYKPEIRSLVRRLVSFGIPLTKCGTVLGLFIEVLGKVVQLDVSKIRIPSIRTVGRFIGEASVASKLQTAVELKESESFTSGGDGTTNKSQNFDSLHYNIQFAETGQTDKLTQNLTRHVRFGNLRLAENHRSSTQVHGETEYMEEVVDLFNQSPLAVHESEPPLSTSFLAMKYHGTHGDHAEDQKAKHRLLASWKEEMTLRGMGAKYLNSLEVDERYTLVLENVTLRLTSPIHLFLKTLPFNLAWGLGGLSVWESMNIEAQKEKELSMMNELTESLAHRTLGTLPKDKRRRLKMFVWTGCGMHKDLNAVKGGEAAMREEWKTHDISPVLFANKDNAAILELAEEEDGLDDEDERSSRAATAAEKRAREVTKCGGFQIGRLTGSLVNDKDDKKDTTNTRYSSYLDSAAETLAHHDLYTGFMKFIEFHKEKPGLNNLESNVQKGLNDPPTLTELACLALYREAVSVPYIRSIRGTSLEDVNGLELGPQLKKVRLYSARIYCIGTYSSLDCLQQVQAHIRKLIDDPQIILSPSSSPQEATLCGNEDWDRPDTISAIRVFIADDKLPKLKELFKAFLRGALQTWERFSAEFNDDGTIAALTEGERQLAWMPATNDANEGALGSYRVFARKNPNGSIKLFNSLFRYRRNGTETFIQEKLTDIEHHRFLMKRARVEDEMGQDRKRRREVAEAIVRESNEKQEKRTVFYQKRQARDEELRGLTIELNPETIQSMKGADLKNQLDKLRKYKNNILKIPADGDVKKNPTRIQALLCVLQENLELVTEAAGETSSAAFSSKPMRRSHRNPLGPLPLPNS
ncbi:hypothetical protein A7U60_g8077 [Sanghuangporus baumii]|uniref:Uncharacterized protein n=1 Tax=Sanghuangporus baumii TaxID=108892 RepID=A0A9Q5N3Z8_SANBA|nr:hypothetical protein A7U60_g8077 [Sanghuangporus baumii]